MTRSLLMLVLLASVFAFHSNANAQCPDVSGTWSCGGKHIGGSGLRDPWFILGTLQLPIYIASNYWGLDIRASGSDAVSLNAGPDEDAVRAECVDGLGFVVTAVTDETLDDQDVVVSTSDIIQRISDKKIKVTSIRSVRHAGNLQLVDSVKPTERQAICVLIGPSAR